MTIGAACFIIGISFASAFIGTRMLISFLLRYFFNKSAYRKKISKQSIHEWLFYTRFLAIIPMRYFIRYYGVVAFHVLCIVSVIIFHQIPNCSTVIKVIACACLALNALSAISDQIRYHGGLFAKQRRPNFERIGISRRGRNKR